MAPHFLWERVVHTLPFQTVVCYLSNWKLVAEGLIEALGQAGLAQRLLGARSHPWVSVAGPV